MSSIESVDLSLDSINENEELYSIERINIEGLNSQDKIYFCHLLNLTNDALSQVLKEGRNISKGLISGKNSIYSNPPLCSSSAPTSSSSNKTTSSSNSASSSAADIVPDDYLTAEKELESLLSIQAGNWNQFNENSEYLLTYMVGFAESFPDSPVVASPIYSKVESSLIENYISTVFVNSNGDYAQTEAAINAIETLFGGNVPPPNHYNGSYTLTDYDYYENKYAVGGKVVPTQILHELQVNNLFYSGINSLFTVIYCDEISQIMSQMDDATVVDGDFQIYLQLAGVISQKSSDSENEIAGCANMLMELSTGSTSVGQAEDALSVIVNFATNSDLLNEINQGLDAAADGFIYSINNYPANHDGKPFTLQAWYDFAASMNISDAARDAITDLYYVLTPIYQENNNSINFCLIDLTTQTRIIEDLTTINGDPNAQNFMMNYCNMSVPGILSDLNEYVDEESKQNLSQVNSGLIQIASSLIFDVTQYGITLDKWNEIANQMGISDEARDAITDLYNILAPVYQNNNSSINFYNLDSKTQTQIINDLNTINNDPNAVSFMQTYTNTNVPGLIDEIKNYEYQYPYDDAQRLAKNLLFLRETGEIYNDTIFPGLLDLTSKLLGDSSDPNGDFFTVVGITLDQLEGAAEGNTDDEVALINGIVKLVPLDDSGDSSDLSLINNELSSLAMYFDENTQQEQANVQYITATEKEMLSFLKELYDNPTQFIKAIQQNLNRSNQ